MSQAVHILMKGLQIAGVALLKSVGGLLLKSATLTLFSDELLTQ